VSAAITLMTGISNPVNPTLRRNGTGSAISAAKLTATVMPENSTDRPAVAIAAWTASTLSAPRPRSSRQRVTMNETSVNPVRPHTIRNVVRIEPTAIANGMSARNDPNTRTRTIRAPAPPNRVSANTPTPPPLSPSGFFKASCPVTVTGMPPSAVIALAA